MKKTCNVFVINYSTTMKIGRSKAMMVFGKQETYVLPDGITMVNGTEQKSQILIKLWYKLKIFFFTHKDISLKYQKIILIKINYQKVQFVDYGTEDLCQVGSLKKRIMLEDVPIQATRAMIHGVRPVS